MRILVVLLILSLGMISVNGCCTPYCFFKKALDGKKQAPAATTDEKTSPVPMDKSNENSK